MAISAVLAARTTPRQRFIIKDNDSAIPRFESWRPSQSLSNKIQHLVPKAHQLVRVFMLHRVAKISMCFQRSPFVVGNSTQHECDMEGVVAFALGLAGACLGGPVFLVAPRPRLPPPCPRP